MVVSSEKLAAANAPFIADKVRAALASDYAPAADFKAFSLNIGGFNAFVTAQPSEEAAKSAAVEQCQKRADAAQMRTLRGRRYRRLFARQAASAAIALDQA